MKKYSILYLFFTVAVALTSCSDYHRNPGKTYAPDMVYSRAVDYYHGTEKIEAQGGQYNKMPVPGTVAREQALPDHIGLNDSALAKAHTFDFEVTDNDIEKGRRLYMIYCGICHGEKMDGNGPLYASGKFAAMPANLTLPKFVEYSPGLIYHTIVYGKNAMGSYASQLDTRQRWQVVAYIKKTQGANVTSAPAAKDTVSSAKAMASATETKSDKK